MTGTVWCIVRHETDGKQELHATADSLDEAREMLCSFDDEAFTTAWWMIREHEIGEAV